MTEKTTSVDEKMPFIDRNPTAVEIDLIRMMLSTYCDGSGSETELDGTTRPGWRQIERVFSFFYTGSKHAEDKEVFDLTVKRWCSGSDYVGISIKSKELSSTHPVFNRNPVFSKTDCKDALYLELANSPAYFWTGIENDTDGELTVDTFKKKLEAQRLGASLVKTLKSWHLFASEKIEQELGQSLCLESSRYLTLSYSSITRSNPIRRYVIHTHDMSIPTEIEWEFSTEKRLSGYQMLRLDPESDKETRHRLFDWYGLSGGQLKYYPLARSALFHSDIFTLDSSDQVSFLQRIKEKYSEEELSSLDRLTEFQRELLGIEIRLE